MRAHLVDWLAPLFGRPVARVIAPGYFTMVAIATLVVAILAIRRARRQGLDVASVVNALLIGYVGAVVGGIVFPILVDLVEQIAAGRVPRIRWAGMVAYGGFFGGFGAALLALRLRKTVSAARFLDLIAAPIGLAIALVRVGCFIGGCDYGKVTSLPWAVRFPTGSPAWHDHVAAGWVPSWRHESLAVHPTQLYEALFGVAIFVGATLWSRRGAAREARPGTLFLGVALSYAVGRFGLEMLRGDASRGFIGDLSMSQFLGILVAGAVAIAFVRQRRFAMVATLFAVSLPLSLVAPRAHAQEQPLDPYAQPQPPPAPPAPPAPPPPEEAPPLPPAYAPPPPPAAPAPPPSPSTSVSATSPHPVSRFELGAMLSMTSALNRNDGQVPPLVGGSFTFTMGQTSRLRWGLELEGTANDVAVHRSFLALLSHRWPTSRSVFLHLRGALGGTQVDFADDSFANILALDLRLAGGIEIAITPRFWFVAQPIAFDLVTANNLGGPLFSWQLRFGLAYGWGAITAPAPTAR